ncbi:hypothetical protein Skr01_19350 [Sphaerisporangium krabiense]|nr:hypothetical protein Skr01_19350 [Sphaerisporangium krabiense]
MPFAWGRQATAWAAGPPGSGLGIDGAEATAADANVTTVDAEATVAGANVTAAGEGDAWTGSEGRRVTVAESAAAVRRVRRVGVADGRCMEIPYLAGRRALAAPLTCAFFDQAPEPR